MFCLQVTGLNYTPREKKDLYIMRVWGTLDKKEVRNCKGCLVETMSSWLICISLLPLVLKHRNPVFETWKDVVCVEA